MNDLGVRKVVHNVVGCRMGDQDLGCKWGEMVNRGFEMDEE